MGTEAAQHDATSATSLDAKTYEAWRGKLAKS
jgi:hypothetical protein